MTAMSLIVQPHAAYLLTDTAFYLADGTIVKFGPKVTEIRTAPIVGGELPKAAFALTGIIVPEHVTAKLEARGCADLRDAIDALPAIIRELSDALPTAIRAPGVGDDTSILLALAIWDDATGKPYGFLIGNEACDLVRDGLMEPFQLVRMKNYVMRSAYEKTAPVDFSDPAQFAPLLDGGALLDAQRDDPFGDDAAQFKGVGGQGVLTEIGPAGIRYHLLRTWPDEIGQRIAA